MDQPPARDLRRARQPQHEQDDGGDRPRPGPDGDRPDVVGLERRRIGVASPQQWHGRRLRRTSQGVCHTTGGDVPATVPVLAPSAP
jgi:hypothetical protein